MTIWLWKFWWSWALMPVAIWFARKYWKATREQPLKYLQHSTVTLQKPFAFTEDHADYLKAWVDHFRYPTLYKEAPKAKDFGQGETSHLLDVLRREKMFPWRRNSETWLVSSSTAVRESDGALADNHTHSRFLGMIAVAEARKAEVEELAR